MEYSNPMLAIEVLSDLQDRLYNKIKDKRKSTRKRKTTKKKTPLSH